jgi:hypothetical protein
MGTVWKCVSIISRQIITARILIEFYSANAKQITILTEAHVLNARTRFVSCDARWFMGYRYPEYGGRAHIDKYEHIVSLRNYFVSCFVVIRTLVARIKTFPSVDLTIDPI